jgi:hypothetical protein
MRRGDQEQNVEDSYSNGHTFNQSMDMAGSSEFGAEFCDVMGVKPVSFGTGFFADRDFDGMDLGIPSLQYM